MKNTGSSGSQFSITPTFTNQQVGDSFQQITNAGLPTPIVPSPINFPTSSPGFDAMFRKDKINKAVKGADQKGGTLDVSDVDIKKSKYPQVTQEELEKEIAKQEKKDDKFNFERFMKDQRAFDQKLLNQAYIAGGASDAGKSILEGSKVAAESVIPNMMAGTTGLLASMAKGNTAIAAAFGIPISPMKRMGYYS